METDNTRGNIQIVYFSHGGGPLPLLNDKSHQAMIGFMKQLPSRLKTPDYIIVISAHWEEACATIQGAKQPEMLYDYYGFPNETYTIKYHAPGCPDLARTIAEQLKKNNIPVAIDDKRGFDHGLFIPLMLMYPDAQIPSMQISLLNNLNPGDHISLGKALRTLSDKNILILGSGFSFHNLQAFSFSESHEPDTRNDAFQNWLIETCTSQLSDTEREGRLLQWHTAPYARYCHPREEHLLPLHICTGISGKPAQLLFDDYILGKRATAFLWS